MLSQYESVRDAYSVKLQLRMGAQEERKQTGNGSAPLSRKGYANNFLRCKNDNL